MDMRSVMPIVARQSSSGALLTLVAFVTLASGCAANPYAGVFSAGRSIRGQGSAAESQPAGGDCLMQQREAYEQALGELTVQVLR